MIAQQLHFFTLGLLQMFFIFAAVITYRLPKITKSRYIFFWVLVYWAFTAAKDLFYNIYSFEIVSSLLVFDLFSVPVTSLYLWEQVFPHSMTRKRAFLILFPFIFLVGLYFLSLLFIPLPQDFSVLTLWTMPLFVPSLFLGLYIILIFLYGVFTFFIVVRQTYRYDSAVKQNYSYTDNINLKWLRSLMYFLLLILVVFFALYVLLVSIPAIYKDLMYYCFLLAVWIYIFRRVLKQQVPAELLNYIYEERKLINVAPSSEISDKKEMPYYDALQSKIERAFEEQKLYLNPRLSIGELASACYTNRTYLSDFLNKRQQESFYDYVNRYRVENVSIPLLKNIEKNHSMADVAELSGFGSYSTFRRAFVKYTGKSPQSYQSNIDDG